MTRAEVTSGAMKKGCLLKCFLFLLKALCRGNLSSNLVDLQIFSLSRNTEDWNCCATLLMCLLCHTLLLLYYYLLLPTTLLQLLPPSAVANQSLLVASLYWCTSVDKSPQT